MSESTPANRRFLPASFRVSDWASLESYFRLLEEAPLHTADDLRQWLGWKDELEAVLQEDLAWRYIRMTCHTDRQDYSEAYTYFVTELQPRIAEAQHRLQQRFARQPQRHELPIEGMGLLNRLIDNEIELFRSENLPLKAQESQLSQQYGATVGAMTVHLEGQELTLPQAGRYLLESDRSIRQQAWEAIQSRRAQDAPALDRLFDQLLDLRQRIGRNAGFPTYTDYRFRELARFDYGRDACLRFHHAVETVVRPLYERQLAERQQQLGLESLRPWDLRVDWWSDQPLKPFSGEADLVARTIALFQDLHPRFAEVVHLLAERGQLDLASRKNKAPGGYNYPLMESGIPFIFMNAADQHSDLKTMVHECGHAIHAVLAHACVPLAALRDVPSEVAELASMGMELLTLERWGSFYTDPRDLARAQHQHLTGLVGLLPWIATVDAFQFWLYDHPGHSTDQRAGAWVQLYERFHGTSVNWSGYEEWLRQAWQAQLHLYEVPFYYIEYGIAQLGALQLWQRFGEAPRETLRDYQAALSLGYTRPIPELYAAAGIAFDFSTERMAALFERVGQAVDSTSRILAA